ncbi:MAG: hypothetical protein CMH46_00265 [Muricauda sp.]|nr:hypothetical protein [Allomuricauda sp.]MAU13956.1 hypothetical protein [Allomuricauda sp.]
MDIGYDRKTGISSMVEYLRETDQMGMATKIRGMTFKKFIKNNNVESAINYGFSPLDCLAENITWGTLRRAFSVDSIMKFGMTFDIATKIGLEPSHFGGDEGFDIIKRMKATDQELHDFINTIHKLKQTKWSPAIAKEAGFSFEQLIEMGGNVNTFQSMDQWTIKQMVLEFQPSGEQWLQAGFDAKCTEDGKWEEEHYRKFIATETANVLPPEVEEANKKLVSKDYILKFDANKILSGKI